MPIVLSPWVHGETVTRLEIPTLVRRLRRSPRKRERDSGKLVLVASAALGLTVGAGIAVAFWQAVFEALW